LKTKETFDLWGAAKACQWFFKNREIELEKG
jgi:hypothetical protein